MINLISRARNRIRWCNV
ncbi:Protein of unknown function [Lactobacillus helveticus CIRM-BIA 104]|uniref:Uncharacterized protein n=1 Tax=Lactobacillus helveticus CIRM-BIA 104 TaxID=1226333 RepID=U6FAE9_LACHE|nr:Protein of unknown function [Lactobacillus helveticus CIRM-BIA 104]CDI63108.1 Protein of unknown function [Lactobacillus helveticus CIRM-BIA 103]